MTMISCVQFGDHLAGRSLSSGLYDVKYNDSTHLTADQWLSLLSIEIERPIWHSSSYDSDAFYTARVNIDETAKDDHLSQIRDSLALSLTRVGLMAPSIPQELFEELVSL